VDRVLRGFQELGEMDSGGLGCVVLFFLVKWSHLNGFPVFGDYLSGVSSAINCSSCDNSFA